MTYRNTPSRDVHSMFQSADLYRVELGDHNKKINEGTEVTYKIDKYFNHPGSYGFIINIYIFKYKSLLSLKICNVINTLSCLYKLLLIKL